MYLLWFALVSSNTIASSLRKGSKVIAKICPLTLPTLSYLLCCFAVGAFVILRIVWLFFMVEYASRFIGSAWLKKTVLKMFDIVKSWHGDNTCRSWRRKLACCNNKVSSQMRLILVKTDHTFGTSGPLMTYLYFVHFMHCSMSSQQNQKSTTTSCLFP